MEFILPIFIFALTATITPGPNNIMIMTSGLNFGLKRSLPHYLGICLGFPVMVLAIGSGFGFLFDRFPLLHEMIKVIGILYLLYLSWRIARTTAGPLESSSSKPLSFLQAVLFQWVNPKAWIMTTGAVAAYTSSSGHIYIQVLIIALVFLVVAFPCLGGWMYFGAALKKVLKEPIHQRIFNIAMATLLVVSILPVIIELVDRYFV